MTDITKPAQDDAMLKPCPFCGGGDITIVKDPRDQWGPWFVALCENELCHMLGPAGQTDSTVRIKWNARTTTDAARIAQLEADNARLREATTNPPKHVYWMAGEEDCPRDEL